MPLGRLRCHAAAEARQGFLGRRSDENDKTYGAPISEADAKVIADYLAQTY